MNPMYVNFARFVDPYDLRARLFPGLLVLIPGIAFVLLTWGSKHPVTASLASLLIFCGGPYALSAIVRTWGQRAQARLYVSWGGQPTTILLRHSDSRLAKQTKLQYHESIRLKLSVSLPKESEEALDPKAADEAYIAAANALRPLTNNKAKFPFVFKELVAYGFNRNAYGMRWFGLATCLLAAVAALGKSNVIALHSPIIRFSNLEDLSLPAGLVLLLSAVIGSLWLLHFTPTTVQQSGFSYALRLFEALKTIPKPKGGSQASVAGTSK